MGKKKVVLLTLVHPDFLPPVYAVAQVLRDLGYHIHILTFDSIVPASLDIGSNIEMELMGKHYESSTFERIKLRNRFIDRARQVANNDTACIITFCPFSFQSGMKIKRDIPLAYIALEIADYTIPQFLKSPLSNYRNHYTFQNIDKADFVATPSAQRSAWLAGRCHLGFMPYTILNTSYLSGKAEADTSAVFKEIVPADFLNKKIILYTGATNPDHCILELVQAFDMINDGHSALIITGIKDNAYGNEIKSFVERSASGKRIKLFPYLTRAQMLSLQSNAHIGVCLTREHQDNVKSIMIAPNKAGEYTARNLYVLGIKNEYMRQLELEGIASLAETPNPDDIRNAIIHALAAVSEPDLKTKISNFVQTYFCMQEQLKPLVHFLNEVAKR